VLSLSNAPDTIAECTSANFNGCIAVMDPARSWVAKWQRVDGYVPGVYAVQVVGELPPAYVQDLSDQGVRYVPRDGPRDEDGEQV
jgi:transcription elongation factor SPT4